MRKQLRRMARLKAERAGITQINKRPWALDKTGRPYRLDSKFARNWREWAQM